MSTLRQALYGLALLTALALLLWAQAQRIEVADKNTELAQKDADTALDRANRAEAAQLHLAAELKDERMSQASLMRLHQDLKLGVAKRNKQIEDLKRENEELQKWADQPLPDVARRLRERPAITGAAAYRDWLSSGDPMHAGSDGAAK